MQFERVGSVPMSNFGFQVRRQVNDRDSLKGASA